MLIKGLFIIVCIALLLVAYGSFTPAQPEKDGHPLKALLTGAAEVPGPGDSNGSGTARLILRPEQSEICYEIAVRNIEPATAAHIHAGVAGQAGAPKLTITAPHRGSAKGCASADRQLIDDMLKNPASYYINIHNPEFPNGAVRGQLAK